MRSHLGVFALMIALVMGCGSDEASDATQAIDQDSPDATHSVDGVSSDLGEDSVELDQGMESSDLGSDMLNNLDQGMESSDLDEDMPDDSGNDMLNDLDQGMESSDLGEDMSGDAFDMATGSDMGSDILDPFENDTCSGELWSAADALARLGNLSEEILDAQVIYERTRRCNSTSCGPWEDAQPSSMRFLTYSGGATTHYKSLLSETTLVLFNVQGEAKLSVRHDTHLRQYPDEHDEGIVFGFPAQVRAFPSFKAYNENPASSLRYLGLEINLGRDASLMATDRCARLVAYEYGAYDTVKEYAVVYRY